MKTTKTLRKILSIALCLALVMSYVPMTSLTAFAADDYAVVDTEAGTVTIDGTLGGKTEATEEDITALVDAIKGYVDNGVTTVIVTGETPAMIDMGSWTNTAIGEAIYRLSGSDYYDENYPYNGKIDLILQDVTEIVDQEFYSAWALNSITLPRVIKLGDEAFHRTWFLKTITFGSVLTEVNETGGVLFALVGQEVGGCDLILNCGQMNETNVPTPDLTTNTWTFTYENEFKSITFGTHVSGEDGACDCGAGVVAEVEYGDTATYYATLADALAVAQYRSGANVYALTDCNDDFTIPASVSFYGRDNSFGGNVTNKGDIREGTFNGEVTNEQFIHGGTFNGTVINHDTIVGGTFNGNVINYDRIYDHFDDDRFTLGDDFTIENNGTISCDYHHWKDGVCRLCAYACTRADGTAANCTSGPICSVCGYEYGEALGHTIVEGSYVDNSDGTHSFTCSVCGNVTEEHSGGTATCTTQAVCEACGASYGDVDLTKHDEYINGFCPHCDSYQPATLNADGYYEISNAGQLYWFARLVNIEGVTDANAILTENVDLEGRIWYPIGLYNDVAEEGGETVQVQYIGTFDGNFHTVSNFTAIGTGSQGFIGYSSTSAVVKNLGVINATVSGWNAGAVMAYMGTVENCYAVDCNVTANTTANTSMVYAGAVAGTQQATVINSFAYNCEIIVGEGWAEKSSVSSIGGVTATNSYYLSETETEDGGKTAEHFASGEVAYLLQQGNTEQVWGQDNNQAGAKPMFTSNELYKVVTVGKTGNYSVANVGDTNGDGTVDVTDYQALVNMAVSEGHSQTETVNYDDIVKYDLDGDGYLDVIDAYLLHLFINGFTTVDVYEVGDYDLNGKAFEEADIKAIKHAIENPEKLATYKKYASDINGDGKLDENDLTALTSKYGEITGTECADNVEVYYRWGNSYSTCTATAMCTLCGDVYETGIAEVYSTVMVDPTCTEEGAIFYEAYFENADLFEPQYVEVSIEKLSHNLSDGVCTVCGIIDATAMSAEDLNVAVSTALAAGHTDIEVTLAANSEQEMFSAIRTAFLESTAADGSINLTISGAKTVPEYGFFDYDNDDKNIAGDKLKSLTLTDVETIGDFAFSACTYLESVNLPQVVTIGECAFNEWKKGTKLTSLNLPNATTIGDWAFAYSSLLTSVNLPKVTSIGMFSFGYCDLRTLNLPEVTTIDGEAFLNNYNLVSCSAPKATTIDYYPWGNCSRLETLELTAAGGFTLGNNLFANTPTGQINLMLNKDKESQVTQNEDGTATWAITNQNGGSLTYTFKSITFVDE